MGKIQFNVSGPLALGINWAHDASVSICSPDGILYSSAEERICRIKHYYGFPYQSIETALEYCGLSAADIDFVAFSTKRVLFPRHINCVVVKPDGTLSNPNRSFGLAKRIKRSVKNALKGRIPKGGSVRIHRNWAGFEDRHWSKYVDRLIEIGLMDERIKYYYVPHHRAHASAAFRLNGLEEACVVTIDGKGDGLCATIYKGHKDGRLELLRSSAASDSLGSFYQAITESLGFIPVDGEFKTMGLAALGRDAGDENPFSTILHVENGVFKSTIPWTFRSYNAHNPGKEVLNPLGSVSQTEDLKKFLSTLPREQFAYFAQEHCEKNMLAYVRDAMRITDCDDLAAAGGVMLNVKANALIRDELKPSTFFVFPDSTDSGLAAGAAIEALYNEMVFKKRVHFSNPYMGTGFTDEEILSELKSYEELHGLSLNEGTTEVLADRLAGGKVIGTFQGRLEMGPRALGNRSVIADPRSNDMKDRINLLLKGREYFVPFAPIVLEEDAALYWSGPTDYHYMTFSVDASKYALEKVPAVVHVDGSMRPQVVSREFNPWLYEVLLEFKKRTGVGVLINTSFNRHGLPIVGSPADALDHLINGWVDGLIIGRWYVETSQ